MALVCGRLSQRLAVFRRVSSRLFPFINNSRVSISAFSMAASPPKRVGTHNGSFHCDEALGCFMIRLTDKFFNAEIVRTRDIRCLTSGECMTRAEIVSIIIKAGSHFGVEIISKVLQLDEGHPDVHRLFLATYKSFIEAVDAIDNGVNRYDTDQPPRYVNNTSLSSRVGRLNLSWLDPDQSPERENGAFQCAMMLAGHEFMENVHFLAKSWLPARSIVMECLAARKDIDSSGEIMLLTRSCPWKLHIFELEEEMKIDPSVKYVIYQDDRSENWRLQAVAVSPDKFESRKPLPSLWRGLTDEKLSEVAGISGCIFVHMSGFIGGNRSYEGALAMARAALVA